MRKIIQSTLSILLLAGMLLTSAQSALAYSSSSASIDWSSLQFAYGSSSAYATDMTFNSVSSYASLQLWDTASAEPSYYDYQMASGTTITPYTGLSLSHTLGSASGTATDFDFSAAEALAGPGDSTAYNTSGVSGSFLATEAGTLTMTFNYSLLASTSGQASPIFASALLRVTLGDQSFMDSVSLSTTDQYDDSKYLGTMTLTLSGVEAGQLINFSIDSEANVGFSPVPVPGALWLLGGGLSALFGIKRRRA